MGLESLISHRSHPAVSLVFSTLIVAAAFAVSALLASAHATSLRASQSRSDLDRASSESQTANPSVQTGIWHVTISDTSIAPDSLDIQVGDAVVFTYLGAQAAIVRSDIQPRAYLPAISGQGPSGLARPSAVETSPIIFSVTLLAGNAFTMTFANTGEVPYAADISGVRWAGLIRVLQHPTPTASPTATATATDTPTPSATPSNTPTPTGTVTRTPTPTETATNAPTPTDTPTPTATATSTASATATATPKITFRSAESASVTTGDLTIAKPAGVTAGDVMIASIAVRPSTTSINAPAGWTLIQRVDNANVTDSALAVYYHVAGATEGASYFWDMTNNNTGAVGGIQSFSGVNTASPIDQFSGQNTPLGLEHAAPSITPSANGAMIVTSHAFASAATWTPPAGMTESIDRASVTVPNVAGISLEANRVHQTTAQATGALTAVASDLADVGNAITIALRPLP